MGGLPTDSLVMKKLFFDEITPLRMDPIYTFIVHFVLTIRINSHKLDPIDKEIRICSLKMLGMWQRVLKKLWKSH